jgi:hypothetical protein
MNKQELYEELRGTDESELIRLFFDLLEVLELNSDQLVDAFHELIEDHEDKIRAYLNDR